MVALRRHHTAAHTGSLIAWALALAAAAGCINNPNWNKYERKKLEAAVLRIQQAAEVSKIEEAQPLVPRPAVTPKGGDVPLTLAGTVRLALANNQDIQVTGFDPLLAETDLVKARAVYEATFFMTNDFGRTDRPTQSVLDTGSIKIAKFIEDTYASKVGVKQLTPTGGTWAVYQEANFLGSSSNLVVPNPQWATRGNIEMSQPLLKGFGDTVNQGAIRVANLNTLVSLQDFRQKITETGNQGRFPILCGLAIYAASKRA